MKRKQLNFTERELDVLIAACTNEWWFQYDPLIETSVQPNYDLFTRLKDAKEVLSNPS